MKKQPTLEVLIATYGAAGLERVAQGEHPETEGVEYTVCWQCPEGDIPESISCRSDFRVLESKDRGLSRNRNFGLENARRQLILIADDDTDFSQEGLRGIIKAFEEHPDCGFLTFRYDSEAEQKEYPEHEFDWRTPTKGMYVCSIEIALRRSAVGNLRFDERFGVGAQFCAGEEDLFMHSLMKRGERGHYIPLTICRHDGPTTSCKADTEALAEAKGAVFSRLFPFTWPLRLLSHTIKSDTPLRFARAWLRGVCRFKIPTS